MVPTHMVSIRHGDGTKNLYSLDLQGMSHEDLRTIVKNEVPNARAILICEVKKEPVQ